LLLQRQRPLCILSFSTTHVYFFWSWFLSAQPSLPPPSQQQHRRVLTPNAPPHGAPPRLRHLHQWQWARGDWGWSRDADICRAT
jgi:hypothetical protein